MKFDYNGICLKCGCGTSGRGDTIYQSDYSICFGCGSEYYYGPEYDEDGNVVLDTLIKPGTVKFTETKKKAFGSCLTKENELIRFSKKPSQDRIEELSKNAKYLVIWNEECDWLDVIVGTCPMRKDVVLLEQDFSINGYITE